MLDTKIRAMVHSRVKTGNYWRRAAESVGDAASELLKNSDFLSGLALQASALGIKPGNYKSLLGLTAGMSGLSAVGGSIYEHLSHRNKAVADPVLATRGYQANRDQNSLFDRAKMDEIGAASFAKTLGSEAATGISTALSDILRGGTAAVQTQYQGSKIDNLMSTDPILRRATGSEKDLMRQSYMGALGVGPRVMSDPFVARNFLRQTLITGNGPDYTAMKGIADAEKAVRSPHSRK